MVLSFWCRLSHINCTFLIFTGRHLYVAVYLRKLKILTFDTRSRKKCHHHHREALMKILITNRWYEIEFTNCIYHKIVVRNFYLTIKIIFSHMQLHRMWLRRNMTELDIQILSLHWRKSQVHWPKHCASFRFVNYTNRIKLTILYLWAEQFDRFIKM